MLRSKKKYQASPYAEKYRPVLVARGSCGSALLAEPTFSGRISASAAVYIERFSSGRAKSIPFTSTDKTIGAFVAPLRRVFQMLRRCAMGPVRLSMAADQPTWEKRNTLSSKIRCAIRKSTPGERGGGAGGQFCDGRDDSRSAEEVRTQNAISKDGRSLRYDLHQLKSIAPERGFDSRGEFCMCLSYFSATRPDIARKRSAPPGPFAIYRSNRATLEQ